MENPECVVVKIKYIDDEIEKVEKIAQGDWIDLRAAEDVFMKPFQYKMIPLGVAMKLPDGYEAHVVPRSSTFKYYGVLQTNSMGVIDNSYCGDSDQWYFPVYGTRESYIKKGDRICQFRVVKKQPDIVFEEVSHLKEKNRGGFGSTGVK